MGLVSEFDLLLGGILIFVLCSMKNPPGIDHDCLPGHGVGPAHGHDHVGAIILVGRFLQERRCG